VIVITLIYRSEKMGSKVISFSVADSELEWWEEFEETIPVNKRSEHLLRIIKDFHISPEMSAIEKEFNQYCIKNNLSKDAQLGLLLGPYRVWGGDPDVE